MKFKLLTILLFISSITIFASGQKEEEKNGLNVFTSILPQRYFVETIGGDRVNCSVLVGAGSSPATYQPTPSQIVKLSTADILFTIGVPFEKAYLHKIVETLDSLEIVDTSTGITKRHMVAHTHDDDAHHDDEAHHDDNVILDPHVWLSPVTAKIIAKNILDSLISTDPEGTSYYTERFEKLIVDLDAVTEEIHSMLAPFKGKILFVYHPAFGYFSDDFGLKQIAIETGGKEPTPSQLEDIIHEALEEDVKFIMVQPEFSKKSAKIIADSIDGTVTTLNPLNPDYINNLKFIASEIVKAYK